MNSIIEQKFSLKGKTAVITGSGRGIGKSMAMAMAKAGAAIVIWDIIKDNAESAAAEIAAETGVKTYSYVSDITEKENIKKFVADIIAMTGRVDILINNAGVQVRKPALEFSIDEWQLVLDTHLTATFLITQSLVPHMRENGGGRIINLGSLNCSIAVKDITAYVASKSGIAGLTRSMCVEYAKFGINANAIAPGWVETELTKKLFDNPEKRKWVMDRLPMGKLADAEQDLGWLAVFLSSEASRYINGQIIYSDGGFMSA